MNGNFAAYRNQQIPCFSENELQPLIQIHAAYPVYTGVKRGLGTVCAKKFFRDIRLGTREIGILLDASHKNIVKILGILYDNGHQKREIGFVMEFMEGGSLDSVIYSKQVKYGLRNLIGWSTQAAEGLVYMHNQMKIIHRDVKPSNMLLSKNKDILKLSDFGISKEADDNFTGNTRGTIRYMAPETFNYNAGQGKYVEATDIYALAISMWEIFYRKTPFGDQNGANFERLVVEGKRPLLTDDIDAALEILIRMCWTDDISDRPSALKVLENLKNMAPPTPIQPSTSNQGKTKNIIPQIVKNEPLVNQLQSLSIRPIKPQTFQTLYTTEAITVYLLFNKPGCFDYLYSKLQEFLMEACLAVRFRSQGNCTLFKSIGFSRAGLYSEETMNDYLAICGQDQPTSDFSVRIEHPANVLIIAYNSIYFNQDTPNDLSNFCNFVETQLPCLMQNNASRARAFLQNSSFNCLVVGRWQQKNTKAFITNMNQKGTPLWVNRMNYYALAPDLEAKPNYFDKNALQRIHNAIENLGEVHSLVFILDSTASPGAMGEAWKLLALNIFTTFILVVDKNREQVQTNADLQRIMDRFTSNFTISIEKINLLMIDLECLPNEMYNQFETIYERAVCTLIYNNTYISR